MPIEFSFCRMILFGEAVTTSPDHALADMLTLD
jgi:hypothetical protein